MGSRPRSAAEAAAFLGSAESAPATSSYWSSMRAAMRCTAPIKAPCPPPTMPSLMRPVDFSVRPETILILLRDVSDSPSSALRAPSPVRGREKAKRLAFSRALCGRRWPTGRMREKVTCSPNIRRALPVSVEPAAKSSKAFAVVLMMWLSMKGAPSMAPCVGILQAAFPFQHGP